MFKHNKYIQNIINVLVCIICVFVFFLGSTAISTQQTLKKDMKSNIEKEWRLQAKRTLSNIQDQFMYDLNNGLLDPSDEYALQLWAKRNISGVLNGGQTGDTFMVNLGNEKFLWDGSPDCAKEEFITNGRYLKDEAPMHYDKAQAELIISKMKLAQSTLNTQDNYWWNFDGSPEYLEWIVIPPGALGFNSEPSTIGGVKNNKYNKILIALGTQQDEIESTFTKNFEDIDSSIEKTQLVVYISMLICAFNIVIYVYLNKKV